MLNIDYSNPRRFLMSAGITMVFLGILLWFGLMVFVAEKVDNVYEMKLVSASISKEYENDFFTNAGYVVPYIRWIIGGLLVGGLIVYFQGINLWHKQKWGG